MVVAAGAILFDRAKPEKVPGGLAILAGDFSVTKPRGSVAPVS
jgi:hypothetical protein